MLSADRLGERARCRRADRVSGDRALDEAAAEHARLPRWRVVEHAGLPRGHALLARDQFDLVMAVAATQPGWLRRAGRAHPHEYLEAIGHRAVDRAVADPVDVAKPDAVHPQGLARADHDAACRGIEPHHIERRARRDPKPLALADGEMRDALMRATHA